MSAFNKEERDSPFVANAWEESLRRNNFRQGVGLIIKHADRYLFAIGKESFWRQDNQQQVITYTARKRVGQGSTKTRCKCQPRRLTLIDTLGAYLFIAS